MLKKSERGFYKLHFTLSNPHVSVIYLSKQSLVFAGSALHFDHTVVTGSTCGREAKIRACQTR